MAKLMDYCDGVQHIGIPTADMAATCKFYEELGFENVHQAEFGEGPQHVCFLKFQNLVLECYDEPNPAGQAGAINHFAINCTDIDGAYKLAQEKGYTVVSEGIEALPFWEKGIRFFIIQGPNKERVEIDQIL